MCCPVINKWREGAAGRRILAAFVLASATVHAVVLSLIPGYGRDDASPPITLEVALSQPEPLPVAPPEPERSPPARKPEPQHRPAPRIAAAKASPTPQPEQQAPVLALPATQAPAESAFTVPAPKPAEPPRAPEQKSQVAGLAAAATPVFNAAYLRNPAPQYPLAARRTGQQGTATVRVLVSAEGLPARVDLEKSSGFIHLDNAALEAVKGWRFTPARRGNEAVEGWVLVPIVFRLEL